LATFLFRKTPNAELKKRIICMSSQIKIYSIS
jgi:hypothetical protein